MVGPAMCFHNFYDDYTPQKRKRRGLVVYLEVGPGIGDVEPSGIMALFPIMLL